MKTKLILIVLLASTIWSFAQVVPITIGATPDDGSGEKLGRGTWVKLNYDLAYMQSEIAAMQTSNPAVLPTNLVLSSTIVPLMTSNFYVFNTSNYLGNFTNLFSLADLAQAGGTNYPLTNIMSTDGGATWQPYALTNPTTTTVLTNVSTNQTVTNILTRTPFYSTNAGVVTTNYFNVSSLGTNFYTITNIFTNYGFGGVELAVLSSGFNTTGSVSVASITPFKLVGNYVGFAGQVVDFGNATVLNLLGGSSGWQPPASQSFYTTTATNYATTWGLAGTNPATGGQFWVIGITNHP